MSYAKDDEELLPEVDRPMVTGVPTSEIDEEVGSLARLYPGSTFVLGPDRVSIVVFEGPERKTIVAVHRRPLTSRQAPADEATPSASRAKGEE